MIEVKDSLSDLLLQKIKHFLIFNFGKTESEATDEEFTWALSMALREEIMVHWTATLHSFDEKNVKTLSFLSLEYLPGKFLANNLLNIGGWKLVQSILAKTERSAADIIACDPEPGLGNGGLGRLASCFLDSLATLHLPAIAYGLRYQYGIFQQKIDAGRQIEKPDLWLLRDYPWQMREDSHARNVRFGGNILPAVNRHGDEVFHLQNSDTVMALPYDIPIVGYGPQKDYSVLAMRLWSTKESPQNFELQRYNAGQLAEAKEDSSLTDVLYPSDYHSIGKRIRLKQEFLLVSASLQDIMARHLRKYNDVTNMPDKIQIQINDTHAALVVAEMIRRLTTHHDTSFDQAVEITQGCCNFTNHTIMKEALEEWEEYKLAELLPREHKIIQKLNQKFCNHVREKFPDDEEKIKRVSIIENGQVKMAPLCIVGCKKVNGVSQLHGEILKAETFKDYCDIFPEKFSAITNGVTIRRWLMLINPKLTDLFTAKIGKGWIDDFTQIAKLGDFASDKATQEAFLAIKKENKQNLFNFLLKNNPLKDINGKITSLCPILGPDALVDVQIKRFHEYKRQLMVALHTLILMKEIERDPNSTKIKRFVLVGGKSAPSYAMAKKIMLLLSCITRKIEENPVVASKLKLVLVENYNVSKASLIIPAADLSEQISTAGKEASGTGNMKLSMNGALTIGTEDGANIEMKQGVTDKYWPFTFGLNAEEVKNKKPPSSWDIYQQNDKIKEALDSLNNRSLVYSEEDHRDLCSIYDSLFTGYDPNYQDQFCVVKDLPSYYETQKKVEQLYLDPHKWAEMAIHNMAGMGNFSSDIVIDHYAKEIWGIEPCPIDPEILKKTRQDFSESLPAVK